MTDALTDGLASLNFRRKANSELRAAAAAGDVSAFAEALHGLWDRPRKKLQKHFEEVPALTVWASSILLDEEPEIRSQLLELAAVAGRKRKEKAARQTLLHSLLENAALDKATISPGLTLLTAEMLLRYGTLLSAEQTASLYQWLVRAAETGWAPENLPETPTAEDAIRRLVASAEAPFVLSLLLDDLQLARTMHDAATQAAAAGLEDSTDTDGTLAAALGRCADDWLAPFVRIAAWAKAFRIDWAAPDTVDHFFETVGYVARLMTADGIVGRPKRSDILSIEDTQSHLIMQHAARLAGYSKTSAVAGVTTAVAGGNKKKKGPGAVRCSDQSDWAEVALLRRGLTADSDVVSLEWDDQIPQLHIAALGSRILGGPWESRVTVEGQLHEAAGEWVCTCWFEDRDVAFAELEAGADDGIRHVRHVMLSLRDHFALLTETVTSSTPDAAIEIETSLPIAAGVSCQDNTVTRELFIQNRTSSCRAVPLWLADDRIQNAAGNFLSSDQQLVSRAESAGGVTVPLLLDWHPERQSSDADWSRLTVTEDRQVVSPQAASGFRVRVGDLQLLAYRSLQPGDDLRAVLGLHTANETVYGRVESDGDIDPLVLVEAEA